MFDLSQADTNVWPAVDVDSAALLKRACGHEIGSQDHFGSLRRHYPHQVLRVPRKIRGSQPTAPLQKTNYSRRLPRRKGIHSVTLSGSVSLFFARTLSDKSPCVSPHSPLLPFGLRLATLCVVSRVPNHFPEGRDILRHFHLCYASDPSVGLRRSGTEPAEH